MKNLSFTIAILFSTVLLAGCMSSEQKKQAADAQVVIATDNLNKVQANADVVAEKAATEDQLKTFRLESDLKIKNNEVSIAELKLKMNKPGTTHDQMYAKRIDSLEFRNSNLKKRMSDYEQTHSDWEKFKRDFNRDLDDLGDKLKSIAKESRK
ncbi:MAG: hypothetical protein PHR83_13675 [Paludibacter sp.]|nr:hypothetical protein [Paludibacter sp.]